MKRPVEILFLGMDPSPAIEAVAREKALKLDQYFADIESCKVSIDLTHKHQSQGRQFDVRIDLTIPGHELTISRVHDEDAHIALRDAFEGMKRKLDETVRRQRNHRP